MKTIVPRLFSLASLLLLTLPLQSQVETIPFFQPGFVSQDVVLPNSPLVEIDNAGWTGTQTPLAARCLCTPRLAALKPTAESASFSFRPMPARA